MYVTLDFVITKLSILVPKSLKFIVLGHIDRHDFSELNLIVQQDNSFSTFYEDPTAHEKSKSESLR